MRLEKGYLHWKADILTEFDPFETGLGRFVKIDKNAFIGKAALQSRLDRGPRNKLVTLEVGCDHAPAHAGASVVIDRTVVGTVTSGDWGHRIDRNLALAFVRPDLATPGSLASIDILGDSIPAKVIETAPYDPAGERVRA